MAEWGSVANAPYVKRFGACTCPAQFPELMDDRKRGMPNGILDQFGKVCGRCGGWRSWVQDCGYCGRAMYRSGRGGWTNPNRCVGCSKLTVPPTQPVPNEFRNWQYREWVFNVCTCKPLAGFDPRRVRKVA